MEFKVGQIVVLENTRARGMGACIGAKAKVIQGNHSCYGLELINVEWVKDDFSGTQRKGRYQVSMFAALPKEGEQLLFNFMYEEV